MNNRENKYGFGEEKEELRPIRDKELEDLNWHTEGDYRVFDKVCTKCQKNYTISVPEKFFHETLSPNLHRDRILEVIKKKYCKNCESL